MLGNAAVAALSSPQHDAAHAQPVLRTRRREEFSLRRPSFSFMQGDTVIQRYGRWSALYCRGAPVGSEAPGGRALGADVDRLLSRRRDVRLWSRLARCEVSFGM